MSKAVAKNNMKAKIEIKQAETKDFELVYQITKEVFADYNKRLPSRFLKNPALKESKEDVKEDIKDKQVLIAYYDNEPVGTVRYSLLEDGNYLLSRLGVLAPFRGLNVGSSLVKAVEEQTEQLEAKGVLLYSAASAKKVLKFYQKLGYKIIKIQDNSDYKRAVLYKDL